MKSKCTRKKATWGHRFLLSNFGSKILTSVFKYVEKQTIWLFRTFSTYWKHSYHQEPQQNGVLECTHLNVLDPQKILFDFHFDLHSPFWYDFFNEQEEKKQKKKQERKKNFSAMAHIEKSRLWSKYTFIVIWKRSVVHVYLFNRFILSIAFRLFLSFLSWSSMGRFISSCAFFFFQQPR